MAATVDDLLRKFGDPGRYQLVVLALTWMVMCSLSLNNLLSLFTSRHFPHNCKLPPDWPWSINESIPILLSGELDSCSIYVDPDNHSLGTKGCEHGWQHHPPTPKDWSVVQEWDLVCDRHYMSAVATSVYFTGIMAGSLAIGYLSDRFGRKPVMLISMYIQIVIGVVLSFSVNYVMYVILRFAHGFILQGTFATSYAIAIELFLPQRRTAIAVVTQTLWPVMIISLSFLSYCLGNWRHLHLAVTLPALISVVYYWIVPESIRWLLSTHKARQTCEELRRLARRNGIVPPADLEDVVHRLTRPKQTEGIGPRSYGIKDLFRKKRMRITLAVTCYMHFVAVVCFYGIAFSVPSVGGNFYASFAIGGSIELLVMLGMYFVLVRFGRKEVAITCTTLCAFFTLVTFILQVLITTRDDLIWLTFSTSIVGFVARAVVTAYFSCLPIYANELFPTVIRTLGNGFCNFFGRIGGMIAPQILLLDRYIWQPLPFLLFTIFSLIASASTLLLPETLNKPLPEIPDDIDRLWETGKGKKWVENALNNTAEEKIPLDDFHKLTNNHIIANGDSAS